MYVEYSDIKLTLKENEIYTIGWALLHDYGSEKNHWAKFGVETLKENHKHIRKMIFEIFSTIGRIDIAESRVREIENEIEKLNKEYNETRKQSI